MKGPFKPVSFYDFNHFKLKMLFTSSNALLQTARLIIPPDLGILLQHLNYQFCVFTVEFPVGQP